MNIYYYIFMSEIFKIVKDTNASNITVTESKDTSTGALTYTIGQSDIASASLLGTLADDATKNTAFGKAAAAQAEAERLANENIFQKGIRKIKNFCW